MILGAPDAGEEMGFSSERYPFEPGIGGAGVVCQRYTVPKTGKTFVNWILKCPRPGHGNCIKKRHKTEASTAKHGAIEPVAYLHAWILKDSPPGVNHNARGTNPTQAEVDAYVAAHRPALVDIVSRLGL